jgi:hypothetical protein
LPAAVRVLQAVQQQAQVAEKEEEDLAARLAAVKS